MGANLLGANLHGADLTETKLPDFQLPAGELRGWKKAALQAGTRRHVIVELIIPTEAPRTACLVGPMCRSAWALVVSVDGRTDAGAIAVSCSHPREFSPLEYRPGEIVRAHEWSDDILAQGAPGVHFLRTRREAEEWFAL